MLETVIIISVKILKWCQQLVKWNDHKNMDK